MELDLCWELYKDKTRLNIWAGLVPLVRFRVTFTDTEFGVKL